MAVGDKWEVKFYAVAGDQVGINVRHYYTLVETGGGIGVQDMVDQISAQASFSYRAWLSNQARYVGATMQLLNVIPPPSSPTVTTVGAGDGVAIGGMLPRQVAGLIHYKTAVHGRHGRGRSYIPFGSEEWNGDDAKLSVTGLAALDTVRAFLGGPLALSLGGADTTLLPQLRDRVTNTFGVIVETTRDDRWATQKRRGSFGRTNPIPF